MGISRSASTLIAAAGKHVYNAHPYYSKDNFVYRVVKEYTEIAVAGLPVTDKRLRKVMVTGGGIPDGTWDADLIADWFPYLGTSFYQGEIINKSADKALLAHGSEGGLLTIKNACVTRMPELTFGAGETPFGAIEFTGALADGADQDDADAMLTYAETGGTYANTGFSLANILTKPHKVTLATHTGFTDIVVADSIRFIPRVILSEVFFPNVGLIGYRFEGVEAELRFTPLGPTRAQIISAMKFQGTGATLGSSEHANAVQATVVGEDGVTRLTAPKVALKESGFIYGKPLRTGELVLACLPSFSSGSYNGIATLAVA